MSSSYGYFYSGAAGLSSDLPNFDDDFFWLVFGNDEGHDRNEAARRVIRWNNVSSDECVGMPLVAECAIIGVPVAVAFNNNDISALILAFSRSRSRKLPP